MHEKRIGAAPSGGRADGPGWYNGHIQTCAQHLDVSAYHAETVTGICGVFEPGNGLLFGAEQFSDLFLGQSTLST